MLSLYTHWRGHAPKDIERLPGAGSNRAYYRLWDADGSRVIGVVGTNRDENAAFIALARHFRSKGLPVPEVLAVSDDGMRYLQSDLGTVALFDRLRRGREAGGHYNAEERQLLLCTIRELPRMQILGAHDLDWSVCYPQPAFDEDSVRFDLNYFKYCFLKPTGVEFHELKLEADFRRMAADLTSEPGQAFLYRDFQARNIMLDADGNPHFIDFQGGRQGPVYYDLASFLWQASAHYSHKLRRDLVAAYYDALRHYAPVPDKRHFVSRLALFVLFRTLQVLGAYGFRGYFERKQHFINSIPGAIQNLRELLQYYQSGGRTAPYPHLFEVLTDLTHRLSTEHTDETKPVPCPTVDKSDPASEGRTHGSAPTDVHMPNNSTLHTSHSTLKNNSTLHTSHSTLKNNFTLHTSHSTLKNNSTLNLTVRVFSFSYKRGIPDDPSGNGGGYVFDCRSTHNPGRYEPYKQLTGLDEPVIRFLEDDGEILTFLQSVYPLADHHVERFLQRGFTHLMFSFGCTGGQHRSVYCAQHLAEHLHNKYGITVHVCHREQKIEYTLKHNSSLLIPNS